MLVSQMYLMISLPFHSPLIHPYISTSHPLFSQPTSSSFLSKMSPNKGKNLLKNLLTTHLNLGCGNTTPLNVYDPKPKSKSKSKPEPKPESLPSPSSSSSDIGDGKTSTTFSPGQYCSDEPGPSWPDNHTTPTSNYKNKESCTTTCNQDDKKCCSNALSWNIGEGIAVVKESHDPYVDFRHSMLQMIFEKELFSPEDLRDLLRCFLQLNSSEHHNVILRAFVEVCHVVVSGSSPPSTPVIKP